MKNKSHLLFVLIFTFFISNLFAQNAKKQEIINQSLKSQPISEQFNTLINMSPDFQGFKNIRHINLNKFKNNFNDSLKANSVKFDRMQKIIDSQKENILNLENKITELNTEIKDISQNKDTIDFFGMRLTKSSYNTILWTVIFALLAGLLFFMFQFKNSNTITKEAKRSLAEIEEEYDQHRKKALEREQVLRRQLQDEINKQRNI